MKYLALGGLALALSACAGTGDADKVAQVCSNAKQALLVAEAVYANYPDQSNIPASVLSAYVSAKQAIPMLCPAEAG
jgi:hypothetical protein